MKNFVTLYIEVGGSESMEQILSFNSSSILEEHHYLEMSKKVIRDIFLGDNGGKSIYSP